VLVVAALVGCRAEVDVPASTPPEVCSALPAADGLGCVIDSHGSWGAYRCPNTFVAQLAGPSPDVLNLRFERLWRGIDPEVLFEGRASSYRFEYTPFVGAQDDDVLARLTVWLDSGECGACEEWLSLSELFGVSDLDDDSDGTLYFDDCDDCDPTAFPGAFDPFGDGVDQDCDGGDGRIDVRR
jgi:hypothetical protein